MSTQELLAAINHLSPAERLMLLEALARSLREELQLQGVAVPVSEIRGIAKSDRVQSSHTSSVNKLRGLFKTGGQPPTDAEIKEDYTRYLEEKYS